MVAFIHGGTESTSHELMWALFCVATYPKLQQKIVAEMKQAGVLQSMKEGRVGGGASYTDVMGLRYLAMVIKEVIRMFPVGALGSGRMVTKDREKVYGHRVPKGTNVVFPIYSINHVPWLWDKPEEFRPERWSKGESRDREADDTQATSNNDGKAVWAFSNGPRACIGQRLALSELQIGLAVLIANFKFRLVGGGHRISHNVLHCCKDY